MTVHPKIDGDLIAKLDAARDRLDATLDLIDRARDVREMLRWGIIEMDDAVALVAEFIRASRLHGGRP